jgi:hypothetical protein
MAWPKGGRAVVVMANGDDGMVVVNELMQSVAREYGWTGLAPHVIDAVTLSAAQMQEVAGSYGRGLVVITAQGPSLGLTYGGAQVELVPQGADAFIADPSDADVTVKLVRAADGKVKAVAAQGLTIARDP